VSTVFLDKRKILNFTRQKWRGWGYLSKREESGIRNLFA